MKLALGVMLVGTLIIGCGSSAPRAKAPSDPAGTTTLSSATQATPAADPNPRFLTTEAEAPAPARTWGAAPSAPDSSEAADLAQNPYTTTTRTRDIYDPN